ncbi:DUF7033 domain-containing protein [Hymenobacter sp. APR13]|uniref:DUF7033 domain-containing protein n=1 Tax=Hymenobacter sp. APR13 TaxID=1356852 RepID=UPI0004E04431|nr:hypothetical protein [Hymenobacter sp. APR13]AII50411.1 hypothetical protein N008_00240 [Hymenobacter sp. APR13]
MLPPLPPVVATTPESRLAYVLHHFWQAYDGQPQVTIGYAATQPQVEIAEAAGSFFSETGPYPAPPNWRDWHGQQLPFFFDPHPEAPLLELLPAGRARINADIISAAFYLLSGWQEFFSDERDRHGRFPFAASVQHRYGFVAVPVVNYYFEVLKTAVEHATGQPLAARRWAGGAPFATFVTHDIDSLHGAWKAPAKAALRSGRLLNFGRQLWRHFTQPDAWDNLELVQRTVAEFGAKSTFFFLPEHRKAANGTPNADYDLKIVWPRIKPLVDNGAEIGLHASLLAINQLRLDNEVELMSGYSPILGLRFHYLRWEPRSTPSIVKATDCNYESTLGFAEHYGFRNSYCLPFQPFDFQTGKRFDFLEIPLNVMDATLHHPNYLQLAPDEILPALTPMFREIERFGGVCTLLWHNDHFDPANTATGPRQFAELMHYLRSRNTAFVNGTDIWQAVM